MSTAYLVLLILLILYIPIWIWVWRCPEKAERFHLVKYGPAIMIKSHLGMKTMDRLAKYPRFWRAFGFISKVISAILLFLMMYMMVMALLAIPSRIGNSSIGIEYALAIPGFNPILPLSYGIVALVVAMVVHEMGHGIQTRANGCKVDSTGLLYGVVPLGAFVEPNEEEMSKQSRRVQLDMYTAGISVNTFVAIISIALLIFSCGFVSSPHDGSVGVYAVDKDSPAYYADIPASAIIISISDEDGIIQYDYTTSGSAAYIYSTDPNRPFDPKKLYTLEYEYKGETETVEVRIGAFIKSVTNNSPASSLGLNPGDMLYSIEFDGETTVIRSPVDFTNIMKTTSPGDTITVTTIDSITGDVTVSGEVELGSKNGIGFLGINSTTSGMTLTTPEILIEKASNPFYGATDAWSYVTSIFSYLSGPFNGFDPISDEVKWWYDTPLGDIFWVIMSLLYWIFWLDLLLGISNALPAYPFDGGFIFAGGINWLLEKCGISDAERRQKLSDSVSNSVSTVTLFMFALVFISFLL